MKNKVIRDCFDMAYKETTKNNEALLCIHDDKKNEHVVLTATGESMEMIAMIARVMEKNKTICSLFSAAVRYYNSKQEEPK